MSKAQWCARHMSQLIKKELTESHFESYEITSALHPGYASVTFYEERQPVATSLMVPIDELFFELIKRLPGGYRV